MGFTAALMIAPIARVLLGERMSPVTVGASLVGFVGAAIAISGEPASMPEGGTRVYGIAAMLVSAVGYALNIVLLRMRTKEEDAITLVTFMNVLPVLFLLPFLPFAGALPETNTWPLLGAASLAAVGIVTAMTNLLKLPATSLIDIAGADAFAGGLAVIPKLGIPAFTALTSAPLATLGVIAAALLSFVLSFFGIDTMLFNLGNAFGGGSAPWIGLGVTGAILILASLWLIVDFRQADELVASNAPKETEWYVAFGLIVTIAWIYLEALKLVYYLAAMNNRD